MGRQIPFECEHGVTVDGGDFCESEICNLCEAKRAMTNNELERRVLEIEQRLSMPVRDGHPIWSHQPMPLEKETPKRKIDWNRVAGSAVPVKLWGNGLSKERSIIRFLEQFFPDLGYRFFADHSSGTWTYASLDTGLWVANADGQNPWPEGVIAQVRYASPCYIEFEGGIEKAAANALNWNLDLFEGTITMSRFHSLEDGWEL